MTSTATTPAQRKAALLLCTLRDDDRRRLLARLPRTAAATLRRLIAELEAMRWPVAELADELLAEEVLGLTARNSPDLERLVALSQRLSPAWFARALAAWPGLDRNFCLALLDPAVARDVRRELTTLPPLPPRLADAFKAEAMALLDDREAA
ncbi:MAG: hypothetical protein ACTHOH_16520 [Lysobacteraceae bacterium]